MEASKVLKHGLKIPGFLGTILLKNLQDLNVVKNNVSFIVIHNKHAVAVYIDESTIDILDPLGFQHSESFSTICSFLSNHLPGKTLRIGPQIQSDTSTKCAKFALVFLYLLSTGYSFVSTLQLYSVDKEQNDDKVQSLFTTFFEL